MFLPSLFLPHIARRTIWMVLSFNIQHSSSSHLIGCTWEEGEHKVTRAEFESLSTLWALPGHLFQRGHPPAFFMLSPLQQWPGCHPSIRLPSWWQCDGKGLGNLNQLVVQPSLLLPRCCVCLRITTCWWAGIEMRTREEALPAMAHLFPLVNHTSHCFKGL